MRIHYVSGSRADFGLMRRCLEAINASRLHDLGIVLSGQHLSAAYGDTAAEVREGCLPVVFELPVELNGTDGSEMALALAAELDGITRFWKSTRPDLALLLGDRGEMVAAALAAVHLGIFVAHVHGGERTGTLDESFRHVISKLAHFHFPATEEAASRLVQMGELRNTITVIGAPGLVGLTDDVPQCCEWLTTQYGLSPPVALVAFHPVVQEARVASNQVRVLVETLLEDDWSMLICRPNSDAGGQAIDLYLDGLEKHPKLRIVSHLKRSSYLRVLASSNLIIGNSSSGIIESASFGVACVNVGSRQNDRLRNDNTIDCPDITRDAIRSAVAVACSLKGPFVNRYGHGDSDKRLLAALNRLQLHSDRLKKRNAY